MYYQLSHCVIACIPWQQPLYRLIPWGLRYYGIYCELGLAHFMCTMHVCQYKLVVAAEYTACVPVQHVCNIWDQTVHSSVSAFKHDYTADLTSVSDRERAGQSCQKAHLRPHRSVCSSPSGVSIIKKKNWPETSLLQFAAELALLC